jgi:hypothetical protein
MENSRAMPCPRCLRIRRLLIEGVAIIGVAGIAVLISWQAAKVS